MNLSGTTVPVLPARSLTGAHALRLGSGNAATASLLTRVEGGGIYAEVVSVLSAGGHFAKKHPGPVKYEPFSLGVGSSMSQELFDWIAASWGPAPPKKSGAVLSVDFKFDIKDETAFSGALISATTIPALDASSKDAAYFTLEIMAEAMAREAGAGKLSLANSKQKLWTSSNFRLAIDGVDCTKVSRIESFTVRRKITTFHEGGGGTSLIANEVLFPNLVVTLAQSTAGSWLDWHEDFIVDGNNGDGFEREGSISLLAQDLQTELSRIDLHHIGILRVSRAGTKATAELYCEEMVLGKGGA